MAIEIWKKAMFRGYRKVSQHGLYVFVYKGGMYASWKQNTVSQSKMFPVSDSLAIELLGAERKPCPHVGTQPEYSMFGKPGYTCRDRTSGEDCDTIETCTVCGYNNLFSGNPRARAFFTDEYSIDGHPPTTYLSTRLASAFIRNADWDQSHGELIAVSDSDVRLVIWLSSQNHLHSDGALRAAKRHFPNGEVVRNGYKYLILRDKVSVPAK